MPKAQVTYVAPKGDAKVTEMYGHTFYDGQASEIELNDEQMAKLSGNPVFKVGNGGKAADPPAKEKK